MFRNFVTTIFTSLAVFLFTSSMSAQFPIGGQVVDVIDGKTVLVELSNSKAKVEVELQYIDVPEAGQDLHDTVKDHLSKLLMGKSVEYRPKTIFRDHAVGQVTVRNLDISQQMLRDGAAWHQRREISGQEKGEFEAYASLEEAARKEKLGVWSIPGLKPAWEYRADRAKERKIEEQQFTISPSVTAAATRKFKPRPRGNPSFKNVGSLLDLYDPSTRTGILSTSYLPIDSKPLEEVTGIGIDITYYYKENEQGKRDGTFVFTVYFQSGAPRFLTNNNLIVMENEKKNRDLGKPKRKVVNDGTKVTESLIYRVDRATLARAAYNDGIYFKIRDHMIYLTGGRYLLYNLLDVTQ